MLNDARLTTWADRDESKVICQIFRQAKRRPEKPGGRADLRIAAPSVAAATALGLPQIVEGNLRGLSDKPDFPTLPTPGKAEVHETFERLVSLFGRGNRRVDRHASGDYDFSLDALLVFVGKSYAIQSDRRGPCGGGIACWKCPRHDLGFDGPFDFLDKLRMNVEIFEGSWHGLRLSKLPGIFQFVIAVT